MARIRQVGTIAGIPGPEAALEVCGALIQFAERINAIRDDDPSEESTIESNP